ncbi:MAG: phytanoyl-CoA dioxygenase family protein [Candidatus Eremiobacteraeota bacterium]|nr:phytanoyl-CoA dioxygenase family protein [Candidatus Eremiobacteraeota bacterium]
MSHTYPTRRVFHDDALQATLDRDGYVVVDFLNADEIQTMRDWFVEHPDSIYRRGFGPSVLSSSIPYRVAVAEFIASVYRMEERGFLDDYRFALAGFLCKRPHDGIVQVHQDPTFVDEERFTPVQFWVPLCDVDLRNGCLRVVRGSHLLNRDLRPSEPVFPYDHLLETIYADCLTDVPMRAGQAFVFSPALFHSSLPNQTDAYRVAAGAMYVPREAQLLCVDPDDRFKPTHLDVFAVPDEYYQNKPYMSRPDYGPPLYSAPFTAEALDEEKLRRTARAPIPTAAA